MVFSVGVDAVVALSVKDMAEAASLLLAVGTVQNGLGGGVEIVGGLWLLLVSWGALTTTVLKRFLSYLGALIGAIGILTIIPGFDGLVEVFDLGQIVWFLWLGIVMLSNHSWLYEAGERVDDRKVKTSLPLN